MTYTIEEMIRSIVREEIAKLGLTPGLAKPVEQAVVASMAAPVVVQSVDTTIQSGDAQTAARDWFMRIDPSLRPKVISRLGKRPIHSLNGEEFAELKKWIDGGAA